MSKIHFNSLKCELKKKKYQTCISSNSQILNDKTLTIIQDWSLILRFSTRRARLDCHENTNILTPFVWFSARTGKRHHAVQHVRVRGRAHAVAQAPATRHEHDHEIVRSRFPHARVEHQRRRGSHRPTGPKFPDVVQAEKQIVLSRK